MRRLRFHASIFALMCACGGATAAGTAAALELAELLADAERLDGQQVEVSGYLSLGFEKRTLCPKPSQGYGKDCVWLSIDADPWKAHVGKRVTLRGRFDAKATGHLGCCGGTLSLLRESRER